MNIDNIKKSFEFKTEWNNLSFYLDNNDLFDEDFIESNKEKIKWKYLYKSKKFDEKFIKKYSKFYSNNDWDMIAINQKLSEIFIETFFNELDFDFIAKYQTLSEYFILKYHTLFEMDIIYRYQNLSLDFLIRFKNNITLFSFRLESLNKNEKIPNRIKNKFFKVIGYKK